ncbi:MAG: aminotransferase class IV [Clostridia bacterium]|nr:aminotransferase class IV [Clostridia bacterium]
MKTLGYYNGKFGPLEEMTVPMNDRACYFGDGIYEATLTRNYHIFMLDAHLDRLYRSAKMLDIHIPYSREELAGILQDMVNKMDDGENFLYWQITRGSGIRRHVYADDIHSNLWITLEHSTPKDQSKAYRLITQDDTRFFHCNIKTLNLALNCIYATRAERAGCQETVLHRGPRVTECAHSNISILKDGCFRTAPTDELILPGIARMNLIAKCKELGVPVIELPFTVDELMDADEVIVSSSSGFCMSAREIDGKPVGGRAQELLHRLQDGVMEQFYAATAL